MNRVRLVAFAIILFMLIVGPFGAHTAHAWCIKPATCVNDVVSWVVFLILNVVGIFLSIAGFVLDAAIKYTVLDMGTYFGATGISAIGIGWATIRDLMNMLFIFVLLVIAIATILGIERYSMRTLLAKLVIAALLINFSLFFTRVIVDATNIVAIAFYDGIAGQNGNISSIYMDGFALQTIVPEESEAQDLGDAAKTIPVLVFGIILVLVSTFVFLAAALMLVVRFVMIAILLVTSPVAFLSMILPSTAGISKKWWDALIDQALFAPVFFILTYIGIKIFSDTSLTGALKTGKTFNKLITDATSSGQNPSDWVEVAGIAINYIVVIVFMIAALVIAKSMAAKAAGGAVDFGTRMAGRVSFGSAGFAGRQTIGRLGSVITKSEAIGELASRRGPLGLVGRGLLRTGDAARKTSFDARGTFGIKGVNAGQAQKGGFKADVEARSKRQKEFFGMVGGPARETQRKVSESESKVRDLASSLSSDDRQKATAATAAVRNQTEAAKKASNAETKRDTAQTKKSDAESTLARLKLAPVQDQNAIKNAEREVDRTDKELRDAEKDFAELSGELATAENALKNFSDNLKEYSAAVIDLDAARADVKAETESSRRAFVESKIGPTIFQPQWGAIAGAPIRISMTERGSEQAAREILRELMRSPDQKNLDRILEELGKIQSSGQAPATSGQAATP